MPASSLLAGAGQRPIPAYRAGTQIQCPSLSNGLAQPRGVPMSSHREAPDIAKDPVADSTDLYAFISPDNPQTVTIIANYIPLQAPDGGPNFFEFGDDVLYEIKIDNNGDGSADVTYQFTFRSENHIPTTFLYNDGPIT